MHGAKWHSRPTVDIAAKWERSYTLPLGNRKAAHRVRGATPGDRPAILQRERPVAFTQRTQPDGQILSPDVSKFGPLKVPMWSPQAQFSAGKKKLSKGNARRPLGESIGIARTDDHAHLLRSVLCIGFSFPIGAANFIRYQSLELIGAEVNQRLSIDKESRGFGDF